MLQTDDGETEILLGNKQLIGIFFLVAILLGVAFGGGYMVGRGSTEKKTGAVMPTTTDTAGQTASNSTVSGGTPANPTGGETRTVSPSDTAVPDQSVTSGGASDLPLGSPKRNRNPERSAGTPQAGSAPVAGGFVPESGQTFLQVAAVDRNEAAGIADVLRRKGFHAHSVPVPGSSAMYRVIVGPVKDAGDLAATRDELRKAGFGKVFVQHY
ncbi:MAG: SPOR domain-containing protein [Acidobacteriaceae bacterium]|nr:SPOR domain-containing protein [Acidobacteriaceae bacterium]MBV9500992.1 SPOR domain-containing protein [Acidobacteriaceae bacterium]